MSHRPYVLKFGGTSVADAEAFERVKLIVRGQSEKRLVVVVSAMSGVTDALLACAGMAQRGDVVQATGLLGRHIARYRAVSHSILGEKRPAFEKLLDAAQNELVELFQTAASRREPCLSVNDSIASYGERLAAALLAFVLREGRLPAEYIDACGCIVTDDRYGNARPLTSRCEQQIRAELGRLLDASSIPVMGGFIGATEDGETTTLGRNGSDYTAALVGSALAAREIQIWTDVAGVLTTDPRVVRHARTVWHLSYSEAARLARFGAKVLYPEAIRPAAERGIPIRVLNSNAPDERGTLVCNGGDNHDGGIKAIAHKGGVSVVRVEAGSEEFIGALFETLRRCHITADALSASESGMSLAISDAGSLSRAVDELSRYGAVQVESHCAIICLVGEGLSRAPEVAARALGALGGLHVRTVFQGDLPGSLLLTVPEEQAGQTVARLHELFF